MVGNIFYEHSHRLVASAVGLMTIALALVFWLQERRPWLRRLGVAALLLVILQGVIGGLRVVLLEQTLAIVHAAFAQAFFALTVSLAIFTSPEWTGEPRDQLRIEDGRLSRLCAVTTGLIYCQALLGAVVRHTGERIDAHVFFAVLVALHVILILIRVMRFHPDLPKLTRPAFFLGGLLLLQLVLGVASYLGKFTSMLSLAHGALVILTTTHLATGALMLAISLLLTLGAYHSLPTVKAKPAMGQKVLTEQVSG
jgi:cytochrome c oxidase assembly protein subunit 15